MQGITDKSGRAVSSLRSCTTILNEAGIRVEEKQATVKDME